MTDVQDKHVGGLIRNARVERGRTLRDLAKSIGVSPATLSAIENDKSGVSVARLQVLSSELNVPVSRLIPEAVELASPQHESTSVQSNDWRDFADLDINPILKAAIAAFIEKGYHGTTVRSIATRASMSVPGVYHYYTSKQQLLVEILELVREEMQWRIPCARAEGETFGERIRLIVECLALYHTYRRDIAFIGASEMRSLESENRHRIAGWRTDIQRIVDVEIHSAQRAGVLNVGNPRAAGRAISSMCTSIPQWYRVDGPSTPEDIAADYGELALSLLGYRPSDADRDFGPGESPLLGVKDPPESESSIATAPA